MLKESFFYMLVIKTSGAFSKLWTGSFIRTFLCSNSGLSVKDTFLAKFIMLLNSICTTTGEKTERYVKGSFICGALFKCLYPTVLLTVVLMPIMPTKYILALCVLSVILFMVKWIFSGKMILSFGYMDFFVALFAAVLIFSVFISYDPSNSAVMALTHVLFILFYFVVKNTIDTKQKLMFLIWGILISGAFVSLFGIYQRITGAHFILTESWVDTEMFGDSIRIYSTLDNPNVLGEYLIFIIILAYASLHFSKYKFFPTAVFAVSGACMLLTLSRGAWLGLAAAFGIYALAKDKKLVLVGVIALILLPLFMPASILERIMSIGDMNDSSTKYRFNIWLACFSMVKDYWPIGIGSGTNVFVYVFQKYAFGASYAAHSHNLFLQIIIELGITGLVMFVAIIFMFFKGVLSKISLVKDKFLSYAGAAVCAGMFGYLVQGLTDNVWYNYRILAFFWVMIAVSGVFSRIYMEVLHEKNINEI